MSDRNDRRAKSRDPYYRPQKYRDERKESSDRRPEKSHNDFDVPKSKHAVVIKGLPSNVKSSQVEEYLERKVGGPLKTIFFKPNGATNDATIAIRFDDKNKAKTCVDFLHKTLMLGSTVFIDYYQDFNRYNEKKNETNQHNDQYRARSRGRSRDRSPLYQKQYPKDDEYSKRNSMHFSKHDRIDDKEVPSNVVSRKRPPLLSHPPLNPVQPPQMNYSIFERPGFSQIPAAVLNPVCTPYPIHGPLHSSSNRPANIPQPNYMDVPPMSSEYNQLSRFTEAPPARFTEAPSSRFTEAPPSRFAEAPISSNSSIQHAPRNDFRSEIDTFSSARISAVQSLKYQPEKTNDTSGRFRLNTVAVENSKSEMRKEKFLRLPVQAKTKVEAKRKELFKAYQDDCNTYGILTQTLINKNSDLEEPLRISLAEVLKDLEDGYLKILDEFMDVYG